MADEFAAKATAAAQRASEQGSELYEEGKHRARSALEAGRESMQALTEQGRRQVETVSSTIREWPLLSVGIAFVAGCVASRLFFHR